MTWKVKTVVLDFTVERLRNRDQDPTSRLSHYKTSMSEIVPKRTRWVGRPEKDNPKDWGEGMGVAFMIKVEIDDFFLHWV